MQFFWLIMHNPTQAWLLGTGVALNNNYSFVVMWLESDVFIESCTDNLDATNTVEM